MPSNRIPSPSSTVDAACQVAVRLDGSLPDNDYAEDSYGGHALSKDNAHGGGFIQEVPQLIKVAQIAVRLDSPTRLVVTVCDYNDTSWLMDTAMTIFDGDVASWFYTQPILLMLRQGLRVAAAAGGGRVHVVYQTLRQL